MKEDLLQLLQQTGEQVTTIVRAMPPSKLEEGRYENGWNAREILAHVASIEWTYPRLIDLARTKQSPQSTPSRADSSKDQSKASSKAPAAQARGGIDSYNDRQVSKRADASIEELLGEFERNRAATISAVESTEDDLFETEITSAGGISGSLETVIRFVAVEHILQHLEDIKGATQA